MFKIKRIDKLTDYKWIERVEDKLVAKIIKMGWQHSTEGGDMHLFEKEINTYNVCMRVTCMYNCMGGIDSFVDGILYNYDHLDESIDRQCTDADKDVIRNEIMSIIYNCEKIIEKEKRRIGAIK